MSDDLPQPHGGTLVDNLFVDQEQAAELRQKSQDWPSWDLTPRQLCDLELLLSGGFSPLATFLAQRDYEAVCQSMRLSDGTLWPIPVCLDVAADAGKAAETAGWLALRDPEGTMVAALEFAEAWRPDLRREAESVYGTTNPEHPGVAHLLHQTQPLHLSGRLHGIQPVVHADYAYLRHTPRKLREEFAARGWRKVVAFQTRNPMHRAHFELTLRAAKDHEANLLLHPVVGLTKPGDVSHYTRVRCYRALMSYYPEHTTKLSLLPLAMRMAGPREALWHAIIRKNHACSLFIVGRDHAGPGVDSSGKSFYDPYAAQRTLAEHEAELGIKMVPFRNMVYVDGEDRYMPEDETSADTRTSSISGTELRMRLAEGRSIPDWFTFPEVREQLRRAYPPRSRQGFAVFFTGLSGSGKSTVANVLCARLMEIGGRQVTLLDGDLVRKNLSSELGFSREHRDLNIQRIGFVAAEIAKSGGIAICAPIAPYEAIRQQVREMIGAVGGFVLVHVATPLSVCEQRDRKGLYAKARAGIIKQFTGISDPYESPSHPDVLLDTTESDPRESAQEVLLHLEKQGYVTGAS